MNKRTSLEQAITNLEAQRTILGDETVEAAIAGIRMQLAALSPSPEPQKQRKQVTILFADVSSFTAMSETMDAEDVQATMNALWRQVDKAITDHNGRIDKHIGDAVMALWGVNEARENDPEQAIRAALAMQTAVGSFAAEQNIPLKMRVGLNTGPVLLGEVGTTAEFTAMGDTVNIASRLEQAAPIGSILISHDTYRHVRGVFDVQLQDPLTVKGKTDPLQVYVVNRAKARAFRTQTRGVEGIETRMIGRDSELEALQMGWRESVANSQTTLITVIGDAGVGKSRLLYEFEQWLALQPETITLFRGRSAEQTQGTPYFLLRELLATRFGILESDPIADVRRKFETGVGRVLTDDAEMKSHILGQWLGYDFGGSTHIASLQNNAEQLKNRGMLYLTQFWTAMAGKRPLSLFLEDIHWADDSSLDAILDSLRREPALPLLVVALTRSSLFAHRPTWRDLAQGENAHMGGVKIEEPAYRVLTLAPLPAAADRELLAEILQKTDNIPELLFNLVISRADGNPFYMEELVKMLIDGGVILSGDGIWQVDMSQLDEAQIPGTLTGVLQARLDRLEPNERMTLQQASVIGRVFWDTAVETLGDGQRQAELRPLKTREFIYQQEETAFVGTVQYLFKHDLLRDVTYQTVLKKARLLYHGQVAAWLAAAAAANGRSDEYAALIGEHYQAADKLEQAANWYGRAGKQASAKFAHKEAIHYLSLALKFMPGDAHADRFTLLEIREKTYDIQGNREAQQQDLNQLAALAKHLSSGKQAAVMLRQARYARNTSDYTEAIALAKAVIELGQHEKDKNLMAGGYLVWGIALHTQYLPAKEQFQKGLQLAKEAGNQEQIADFLNSLGGIASIEEEYAVGKGHHEQALLIQHNLGDQRGEAMTLLSLGMLFSRQSNFATAATYMKQAMAIEREIGHLYGEGRCLNNLGDIHMHQMDYAVAKSYCEQALIISRQTGNKNTTRVVLNNLGYIAWNQGDYAAAHACYEQAAMICREINLSGAAASYLISFGWIAYNQKEYLSAQAYFEQSLSLSREGDYKTVEGLGLNGLAAVSLAQGNISLAETRYQLAAAIHQNLQQPYYLFENWAGLAKVKLDQGNLADAARYGQQILNYLSGNPRLHEGFEKENPMRAFLFVWEVFVALEQTFAANEILALAAAIMQNYLDKNSDPAMQEMYLDQPHHKVLWAAWQAQSA